MELIKKEIADLIDRNFRPVNMTEKFLYVQPGHTLVFTGVKNVDDVRVRREFESIASFKNLLPAIPLDVTFAEVIANLNNAIVAEIEKAGCLKVTITDEGLLQFKRVGLIAGCWIGY